MLMCCGIGFRCSGGLCDGDEVLRPGSALNHFWKKLGFRESAGDGVRRVTVTPSMVATVVVVDDDEGEHSRDARWGIVITL